MNNQLVLIAVIVLLLHSSCQPKPGNRPSIHSKMLGILNLNTQFFDSNGNSIFQAPLKIWFRDSIVIEGLVHISTVTDTLDRTTVSYTRLVYRYIDLNTRSWYD